MNLSDVLHQMTQETMTAYGLTDLSVGTVTSVQPLAVKIRDDMADIPEEGLWLTEAVIEKKIPILTHEHITSGFRHSHEISGLGHTHSAPEGGTGSALDGSFPTQTALDPDAYTSDQRLDQIICYEDGKPLPVKDGFIILNRGLEVGDRVLMMKVLRSQQFIILSRIFERGAQVAATV